MALKNIRVCDKTGDPGAETVVFGVGGRQWSVDLVGPEVKALESALEPWIAVATPVDVAVDPDDGEGLTVEERAACRKWAQQNEQRLNLPATVDSGRLRQAVVDAWVAEGKPAPDAKRPPRKTVNRRSRS